MGYGTLWLPETVGKDPLTTASWFLANTKTLNLATGIVNIYNREPSPTNVTHGTLKFVGLFDSVDACFAAVNRSATKFHSFTFHTPAFGGQCPCAGLRRHW